MAIYAGSKSQSLAGKSAYQLAVEDGYTGSEAEFKQLLYNLPSYAALGSAALKDIPASGNASSTQVVLGNDTRLTDSRTAKNIQNTYSATSTDPISGKGVAAALNSYLPLSGGTLTGNLSGKYLTGTWLQTTAATNKNSVADKVAIIDSSGWVYYRTPSQIISDAGVTSTVSELNYVDGVTSNIQTQLNAKAPLASPTFTGTPKAPTATAGTNTTQIATTAFVQTALSGFSGGTDIQVSSTQPSGQSEGSLWFKVLE